MFKKLKKPNGITLIALIITIIVLLILAGVSISLVVGDNGVLTQASSSVVKNREAKAKEEVQLAWSSAETKYFTDWAKNTSVDKDDYYGDEELLSTYVADTGTVESSVKNSDGKSWTVKYRAKDQNQLYTFLIDEKGNITIKGGLTISKATTKLKKNNEETLSVELDGITGNVSWESKNPEIVSVTGNGTSATIKALADEGSAEIIAKIGGTIYEDTCTVTIVQKVTAISAEAITVAPNDTAQLVVVTTPAGENVEELTYTYESNDTETATVYSTGIVTGVANGSAIITITGKNDENEELTTTCAVTVKPLSIGDTVTYEPSHTTTWKAEYASSDLTAITDDVTLSSESGGSFRITSWKVLRIDESTGTVELVPSAPTSGTVRLQGAQGYNNGVKLLNDACSELYGETIIKGETEYIITARSINIDDFERNFTDYAITERNNYTNTCSIKYNGTHTKTYSKSGTTYRNSSGYYTNRIWYPVMYEREAGNNISAAVTVESGKERGLGLSSQTQLISRSESLSYNIGAKKASTGIKPKQTYYDLGIYATFSEKFKEYESGKTYAGLLLPSTDRTGYWVASRCITLYDDCCHFYVRQVCYGYFSVSSDLYRSFSYGRPEDAPLFPVVSLSSELISAKSGGGYEVK